MSTPAYVPPSVGPEGLVTNSYASILADNLQGVLNIFGQNQYIGKDSWLYQFASIISLKISDQNQALQLAYNQSSPQTAVGAGLDRQLKMNGLARLPYTYSSASLTLTGTPGTVVTNGAAQDQNGNIWTLPSPLTIGAGGTVTATATCTTPGAVAAEPGTINIINTPVPGWSASSGSVTNASAAVPGDPVETDSQARARQSVSVALPGLTPVASTVAALLATTGVTRIAPGYPTPGGPGSSIENPTGATDSWGNPAHSISMAVEGGTDAAVAQAIYDKKTPGCLTNGTTQVVVIDPTTGFQLTIGFFRPTYTPVFILCQLHGYTGTPTSATLTAVQTALVNYLNSLQIGETVSQAALVAEAMAVNTALNQPGFTVRSLTLGALTATTSGTTVSGTNTMSVVSATGIASGQLITHPDVPPGTTVSGVVGTTVTMSANATGSGTATANFAALAGTDLVMVNYYYVAQGSAADVAVVTV